MFDDYNENNYNDHLVHRNISNNNYLNKPYDSTMESPSNRAYTSRGSQSSTSATTSQVNVNSVGYNASNTSISNARSTAANANKIEQNAYRLGDNSGYSKSSQSTTSSGVSGPNAKNSNLLASHANQALTNAMTPEYLRGVSTNHHDTTNSSPRQIVVTRSTSPFDEGVVNTVLSEHYYNTICDDGEYNNRADSNGIQCCTSALVSGGHENYDINRTSNMTKKINEDILLRVIESQAQNQQVYL